MINFRELDIVRLSEIKKHHEKLMRQYIWNNYRYNYSLTIVAKINAEMFRRYGQIF
ncbi:hypothetical protein [Pectobacterium phage PcaP2EGY]